MKKVIKENKSGKVKVRYHHGCMPRTLTSKKKLMIRSLGIVLNYENPFQLFAKLS